MRTLKDLKLSKKSHKKVEDWLQEWLKSFIIQANYKHAWVYRCDFEKDDFFWFTDCKDILEKDPEAKGQENNLAIRSRKRKVMMELFVKTLLGQNLGLITITCNHCGYRGCWINGLPDGNGHWVHCPKCKKTDIHVFPDGYDNCMNTIKIAIAKENNRLIGLSPPPRITINPDPRLEDNIVKKRKVPRGAWSTILLDKGKKIIRDPICDVCGSKGPFDYAVGICNDCYRLNKTAVN